MNGLCANGAIAENEEKLLLFNNSWHIDCHCLCMTVEHNKTGVHCNETEHLVIQCTLCFLNIGIHSVL